MCKKVRASMPFAWKITVSDYPNDVLFWTYIQCGAMGHMTFQCHNFLQLGDACREISVCFLFAALDSKIMSIKNLNKLILIQSTSSDESTDSDSDSDSVSK